MAEKNWTDLMRQKGVRSIGADPEIFVVQGKQLIPAWEFLPSKDEVGAEIEKERDRLRATGVVKSYVDAYTPTMHFWDGLQAEFVLQPGGCLQRFIDGVRGGLYDLLAKAQKKFPKAELSLQNVVELDAAYLADLPAPYVELGCKPSKNAYGMKGLEVVNPRELLHRFTGGHVHLGLNKKVYHTDKSKKLLVKLIDRVVGIACVSLFAGLDDPIRRRYYGLPGEYRDTRYGIEYRVLSNAWLAHPAIAHMVLDTIRWLVVADQIGLAELAFPYDAKEQEMVVEIIQSCNAGAARGWLKKHKASYELLFKHIWFERRMPSLLKTVAEAVERAIASPVQAYSAYLNGIESVCKEPTDIHRNWKLNQVEWEPNCTAPNAMWSSAALSLATGKLI